MIIYKITNNINGKCYIGQTVGKLAERMAAHFHSVNKKINHPLYDSINKYGKENFKVEIIEICSSIEELNFLEKYYIKQYNSINREFGYNLTDGGKNSRLSEASKQKIAKKATGRKKSKEECLAISKRNKDREVPSHVIEAMRQANIGKKHSQELRDKMRKSRIGKKLSEETKEKMRESSRKRIITKELSEKYTTRSMLGKKHTQTTKDKIKETKRLKFLDTQMGNVKQGQ